MPDKYQYYCSSRFGTRQVNPLGKLKVSWDKEVKDFRRGYKKTLAGKVTFTGEDFNWFYSIEKTSYRCESIPLSIWKYCAGIYVEDWQTGNIHFNDGEWDLDKCTVSFSIEVEDKYSCFETNKDTALNLYPYIPARETVNLTSGDIEYLHIIVTNGVSDTMPFPPDSDEWTLYHDDLNYSGMGRIEYLDYARYNLGGGLYSPAIVYNPVTSFDETGGFETSWTIATDTDNIDNGLTLQSVFQLFLDNYCTDLTLKSDFFQWNPDDVTDINYVTGAVSKVLNLILFQKSDVKRAHVSANATIAEINFANLLSNICVLFNLKWDIDGSNFILEHYSFWEEETGLDLTEDRYKKYVFFKRKYSYQTGKMPKIERFKAMESEGLDFVGKDISYDSACTSTNANDQVQEYKADKFTTDVQMCLDNPASDSSKVSDDGFVLMACSQTNIVITEAGINLSEYRLNNSLAWAQLHRDYHRHGRVLLTGNMNGAVTEFLSSIKTKQQQTLVVPLCCDDIFDPNALIKTNLTDNGDLSKGIFDLNTDTIELDVIFDANQDLIVNEAPIAVNDTAVTVKNIAVDINVLANDSDADGTLVASSVSVLSSPYHGTAVVNTDGTISYTPDTDYVGTDFFYYTVKDDLGETSNIATVNITVGESADAIDDNYRGFKNESLNVAASGVLGNDIGPGATVTAYDAVSVNGGTVTMAANGSFTYVPATDYTGADSFTYTITAGPYTDTATVNITVSQRINIYIKLETTEVSNVSTNGGCNALGYKVISDVTAKYYSDAGGTVPYNIQGYGLTVNVRRHTVYNHVGGSANADSSFVTGGGSTYLYKDDIITHLSLYGCDSSFLGTDYDDTYLLLTGTGYTII